MSSPKHTEPAASAPEMRRTQVQLQGACVVEHGKDFVVMTPDGEIRFALNRLVAEKICKDWFAKHSVKTAISIGKIEWRVA